MSPPNMQASSSTKPPPGWWAHFLVIHEGGLLTHILQDCTPEAVTMDNALLIRLHVAPPSYTHQLRERALVWLRRELGRELKQDVLVECVPAVEMAV
jgi:hypothetical protein